MKESKKSPDAYDITKGEIELILAEIHTNTDDGRISMNEIGKAVMAEWIINHICQITGLQLWNEIEEIKREASEIEEVKAMGVPFSEFITSSRMLTELSVPDLRHIMTIVRYSVLSVKNRIKAGELDHE